MNTHDDSPRHGLRLIQGGKDRPAPDDGLLRVVVAAADRPPFDVDALVFEDDTYFVLGASAEIREPTESPLRVWTELHETEAADPGDVIFRSGTPPRILAVVHDLSKDPTWTEAWVAQALSASLRLARERGFRSLGLQPLGCVHGRLSPDRFPLLLRQALEQTGPRTLERIWLVGQPELFDLSSLNDGEEG
jgi:hypothetical protein